MVYIVKKGVFKGQTITFFAQKVPPTLHKCSRTPLILIPLPHHDYLFLFILFIFLFILSFLIPFRGFSNSSPEHYNSSS